MQITILTYCEDNFSAMGKPTKRPRLASKAAAGKVASTNPPTSSTEPAPVESVQRTKDEKRQAKHAAFLKSVPPFWTIVNVP